MYFAQKEGLRMEGRFPQKEDFPAYEVKLY